MRKLRTITRRVITPRLADDAGMTTVEYSVATVGAAGLAGILLKLLTSDEARNLVWSVIRSALSGFGFGA